MVALDVDTDINAELRYDIIEGNTESLFAIDSLVGMITLNGDGVLDREQVYILCNMR